MSSGSKMARIAIERLQQDAGRLVDRRRGGGIALRQAIEDAAHVVGADAAEPAIAFEDRFAADRAFQRADAKAARIERIAAERQIGDLAGRAARAADELPSETRPMPMPVPSATKAKVRAPRQQPCQCSPLRGEVNVVLDRTGSRAVAQGVDDVELSRPGMLGAMAMPPERGSNTPGCAIHFFAIVTTKMFCGEPRMTAENAFLGALQSARRWRLDGARLIIEGEAAQLVLTANPA